MANEVDIANDYAERFIEQSLAQHAARAKSEVSEFYCIECGDVIPHRRRAAVKGVKTCVDCQETIERSL